MNQVCVANAYPNWAKIDVFIESVKMRGKKVQFSIFK
jgi:hypothetical protein